MRTAGRRKPLAGLQKSDLGPVTRICGDRRIAAVCAKKRLHGVVGKFHSFSEAHLSRYFAEFDIRDFERAAFLLVYAKEKRQRIFGVTEPRTVATVFGLTPS